MSAYVPPRSCPEALSHGPADGRGRCPWCGRRYTSPAPRPDVSDPSDLTDAYELHFDPDYGALDHDQIRRRYQLGQQP